ncbi:MAG: nucleotidyl transferase AbiEii/AbiGii toxin family protein [Bacteroidales bacterium]|nr:nucleotidyl transferase AbiEii/AbiGii toxin family protein [Bacteroidales bacterium]
MINFNEIQNSYNEDLRQPKFKQAMLKEYFQYKILDIINNSEWSDNLVFLGGSNLRIVHNFRRFFDDLDFDIKGDYDKNDHEDMCQYVCNQLAKEGVEVEIDREKKIDKDHHTAYTRYINFPQMLKIQGIHNDSRKKFFVKLDAQSHHYGNFSYTPEDRIINRFEVFTSVKTTPIDVILSMKYCSILERAKGRDFYDITELVNLTKPNNNYLVNRFKHGKLKEEYYGPVHLKERIIEKIKKMETKDWEEKTNEIERYIFNPAESSKILHFKNWIMDLSFLRTFGLEVTGDNSVYDHVLSPTKRLRLNQYNRKVEISYYPDSNFFIPTPQRADVRLSFKNVYGDQIGKPLTDYPEKIERREGFNIINFELNPESKDPVNIDVQFY